MLEENPKELISENALILSDEEATQLFLDSLHRTTDILEGIRLRTANFQMLSLAKPQLRENGISDDLCELLEIDQIIESTTYFENVRNSELT